MNVSKNLQNEEKLREMTKLAFPDFVPVSFEEITDGMCNAIYAVTLDSGERIVCKIAAAGRRGLLHNEPCLMRTEVEALRIAADSGCAPVPKVLYHCADESVCGGEFFFMEYIDAPHLGKLRRDLGRDEMIHYIEKTGKLVRRISSVRGERFGIIGCGVSFDTQHEFISWMFDNVLGDAEAKSVDLGVPHGEIRSRFSREGELFAEVSRPALVHYDIWDNNLMIKDGNIVAVLDWERAVWGDPLMEDRFRRYSRNEHFLRGYGITPTENERRRMLWYDILIFSTMMTEVYYRMYETDGQYHWAKRLFAESWGELFPTADQI